MKFQLVNQFVPPDEAPTAQLLQDLGVHLQKEGHEVEWVGSANGYRSSKPRRTLARLVRDVFSHLVLSWKLLCSRRCDWIICLSDPPALPFTVSIIARLKRCRCAHWAMDVYPQIAVALHALPEGPVAHLIEQAMRFGYRNCDLLIALDRDMARVIEKMAGRQPLELAPWPPELPVSLPDETPRPAKTWLYSGNLGRAHPFQTLLEAQALLEKREANWRLVFQGGGPRSAAAQEECRRLGLKDCAWAEYVPREQLIHSLLQADILIATQEPSTQGLLWPSKLAVLTLLKKPIVWVGPIDGAIAPMLQSLETPTLCIQPGEAGKLADWVAALQPTETDPAHVADDLARTRAESMQKLSDLLSNPETLSIPRSTFSRSA